MILRKGSVPSTERVSSYPAPYNLGRGGMRWQGFSDPGGLSQFGVSREVLDPGQQSSQPHWHSHEDEFLYLLSGSLTVIEDGTPTRLAPGDAVCWPANTGIAHTLRNEGSEPAAYLLVGSRDGRDICHYPGLDLRYEPGPEGYCYTHLDGTPYPPARPEGS